MSAFNIQPIHPDCVSIKACELPMFMRSELINSDNTERTFNKWVCFGVWVPYPARDNVLNELIEGL